MDDIICRGINEQILDNSRNALFNYRRDAISYIAYICLKVKVTNRYYITS